MAKSGAGWRGLSIADPRAAAEALVTAVVPQVRGSARRALRAELDLATARERVMLGDSDVIDAPVRSVPLTTDRTRLLRSAATVRLIAEHHPSLKPHTAPTIAGCGFLLCHVVRSLCGAHAVRRDDLAGGPAGG